MGAGEVARLKDYVELDWSPGEGYDGEVQILEDFTAQVTRATFARERLFPGRAHQELTEDERTQVWRAPAAAG